MFRYESPLRSQLVLLVANLSSFALAPRGGSLSGIGPEVLAHVSV